METYEEAKERIKRENEKIDLEVDKLFNDCDNVTELEKRFFKDFGCINFRDDEYMHEVKLARSFHRKHKKMYPSEHNEHEEEPYKCYHQTVCKCGYSEAVDSSD